MAFRVAHLPHLLGWAAASNPKDASSTATWPAWEVSLGSEGSLRFSGGESLWFSGGESLRLSGGESLRFSGGESLRLSAG